MYHKSCNYMVPDSLYLWKFLLFRCTVGALSWRNFFCIQIHIFCVTHFSHKKLPSTLDKVSNHQINNIIFVFKLKLYTTMEAALRLQSTLNRCSNLRQRRSSILQHHRWRTPQIISSSLLPSISVLIRKICKREINFMSNDIINLVCDCVNIVLLYKMPSSMTV